MDNIKPQPAPQCTLLTVCLTPLRVSDFEHCLTTGILCHGFFFFFNLLQLHPSWRESKPSCLPIVWAGVGTSLVLALHHLLALCHPAALRKFCPGYWCRGGAGTLRRFSSCGDDFDLGRSAL